ncbi:MAG: Ig-like domain-containing protein [Bacteroidales bacterium]
MKRWPGPLFITLFTFSQLPLSGQKADFTGIKIFLNPGHGGNDGDDRHMLETDFWESEGNLEKGLFLRELLESRNATVFMSRTTNLTSDDLPLSSIATMANTANADIFISIHSNGFDGTRNQPLVLFRGYDDQPVYPGAKAMAQILWEKLFEKGNCWTNTFEWVKGDWTFYPEWGDKVGLGVLRTLNMPGVLSEGSYHDYIPEGWRLRNNNHLHHEAWAMLRALAVYENVMPEPTGIIAGTVRNKLTSPGYYFKPGTRDEAIPINNATVTLNQGDRTVNTDNLNNGFFMFDSLAPGDYEIICSDVTDFFNDTITATVFAGKTILADFLPQFDTTKVPVVTGLLPSTADSIPFNQEFTFTFNLPMDRNAAQAAFVTEPSVNLLFEWDENGKLMRVKPQVGFASKTTYLFRLTTAAISKWGVPLPDEYQVSFVTKARTKLVMEKIWPPSGLTGVTLYPRITINFDAPVDHLTATQGIRLINSQTVAVGKTREIFTTADGKGTYSFEPAEALQLNSPYQVVLDAGVRDLSGVALGIDDAISFTTRTKSYLTGNIVESFDNISAFWDPEASGSTTGTDNPLTTFTASSEILRSAPSAGKLNYVFAGPGGGVCRVFDTSKPGIGSNTSQLFAMWVYGDLSLNNLEFWFYSPGSVNQIVEAATIDWAGWDLISIPMNSIGSSGAWQYHSIVIRQTPGATKSGTMYFDDAMVITPTAIDDEEVTDTGLLLYPNPVTTNGSVNFFLQTPGQAEINLFSSNGSLVMNLFSGMLDAGAHSIPWSPSPAAAPGVYTLRFSLLGQGHTGWQHTSRSWVVVK